MKTNEESKNYSLIASGNGQKLEDFDGVILLRPDPQAIWEPPFDLNGYKGISAVYERSASGGGCWIEKKKIPKQFYFCWRSLKFELQLMGFKHTGVFPEQSVNWQKMTDVISHAERNISVLNLFAYTGGATLACALAGARVCHVDAAKSMNDRAKRNLKLSSIDESLTRFIADDCVKFVERELRRGKRYDAIVMDPPSYGRGPKGEMWRCEDNIFELVKLTKGLLSDEPLFYLINSYTTGLQPTVMKNILDINLKEYKHNTDAYEIGIVDKQGITLPCGCSAFCSFTK